MCNWYRPLNLLVHPEIFSSGVGGVPLVSLARTGAFRSLGNPDSGHHTAVGFRIFIGGSWAQLKDNI